MTGRSGKRLFALAQQLQAIHARHLWIHGDW
jgi:hypothetical protein